MTGNFTYDKSRTETPPDRRHEANLGPSKVFGGILRCLVVIVSEVIWPAARAAGKGTDWVNQHPVCTLFLDKLCDLNRRAEFDQAYDECVQLAGLLAMLSRAATRGITCTSI